MALINLRAIGSSRRPHRCVRRGAAYRSGSLAHVTRREADAIASRLGVRLVIDLRSADERAASPSLLERDPRVRWLSLPLVGSRETLELSRPSAADYARYYEALLLTNADGVVAALRTIAHETSGAFLVTCHAGKDRTGLVALCMLSLVGACHECCVEDYAESGRRLMHSIAHFRSNWERRGISEAAYRHRLASPAAAATTFLELVARRSGSLALFLRRAGVAPRDVAAMQKLLNGRST